MHSPLTVKYPFLQSTQAPFNSEKQISQFESLQVILFSKFIFSQFLVVLL